MLCIWLGIHTQRARRQSGAMKRVPVWPANVPGALFAAKYRMSDNAKVLVTVTLSIALAIAVYLIHMATR